MPGSNIVTRFFVDRMGNASSLHSRARRKRGGGGGDGENNQSYESNSNTEPADAALRAAKKLIREQPNVFILNNLLMSVQLFSDYEMEMEEARRKLEANENELNDKLLPEKSVLLPDVLREHFADRIRFTSNCKSDKNEQTIEPLRPVKIYMMFENVVITEKNETRHYLDPNELTLNYNFILKESNIKGYVRLEQPNVPTPRLGPGSDTTDLSSIAETEEVYSEDESVYGPIGKRQTGKLTRQSSTSMPDLFDEDYFDEESTNSTLPIAETGGVTNGRINVRTPRPKRNNRSRKSRPSQRSSASSSSSGYTTTTTGTYSDSDWSIPDSSSLTHSVLSRCMKRITFTSDGNIYNPRNEPKRLSSQQRRIREAKLARNYDVVYVNGYELSKHFFAAFRNRFGELLNFDESTLKNAKRYDATIRLEKIGYISSEERNYLQIEQYEVIPCFRSPWPEWARGWLKRSRRDWPRYEDLFRAEKFKCCLVPEAARSASVDGEPNQPLWKLNWSLGFPVAERYLETCLSASQATVLTVALMLHKTFVRAVSSSLGLEPGHIRNLLFWMVEKQPEWSELHMGEWMVKLLESLHNRVQQRTMLDYFMHERDLFASANRDDLLHAQKQLKRIIENPVMFVFHAMEKIQYVGGDDSQIEMPMLDYRELRRLLTLNELVLINPALETQTPSEIDELTASGSSGYARRESGRDYWTEIKLYSEQYNQMRKRSTRAVINPQRGHDSIIDIQEKCEPLTSRRLSMILIFFAGHFLKMAHCCHEHAATRPKLAYLEQTRLLADLLAEDPDHEDDARQIRQRVRELRDQIPQSSNNAPQTPRRNADMPVYDVRPGHSRDVSEFNNGSRNGEDVEATGL